MASSKHQGQPLASGVDHEDARSVYDVPMSVVQALYHEITGKTENLLFHSNKGFLLTFDDVQILYSKIHQTLEHYQIIGPTTTITVRYRNDRTAIYSSWEKFSQIDLTKREPIAEIGMRVELVVNFPSVEKAFSTPRYQRYIIDLNLSSKAVLADSMPNMKFLRIEIPSVHAKIEYVDYVFAKKLLSVIEEWVENLPEINRKWHYPKLQQMSFHYWWILGKLGTISALVPCYLMLIASDYNDLGGLAVWGLLSVGFVTFIQFVMKMFAEIIENYVDSTRELSYIKINRGDEENFQAMHERNKNAILKAATVAGSSIVVIALNLLSTWIYEWL